VTEYAVQVLAMYYHIDEVGNISKLAIIKVCIKVVDFSATFVY